jgi:hypothetical protein
MPSHSEEPKGVDVGRWCVHCWRSEGEKRRKGVTTAAMGKQEWEQLLAFL